MLPKGLASLQPKSIPMQLQEVKAMGKVTGVRSRGLPGVGSRCYMRSLLSEHKGNWGKKGQNCICKKNYRKGMYGAIEAMKCKEDSGNLP